MSIPKRASEEGRARYPRRNNSSMCSHQRPGTPATLLLRHRARRSAASRAARCRFLLQRPRACNPKKATGLGADSTGVSGVRPPAGLPVRSSAGVAGTAVEAIRRCSACDFHRRRDVAVVHGTAVSTLPGRRRTLGRPARFARFGLCPARQAAAHRVDALDRDERAAVLGQLVLELPAQLVLRDVTEPVLSAATAASTRMPGTERPGPLRGRHFAAERRSG